MTLIESLDLAIEAIDTGRTAAAKEILFALSDALKDDRVEPFFPDFDPCKHRLITAAQDLGFQKHGKSNVAQFGITEGSAA